MKLAIKTTTYPNGLVITHAHGMDKPKTQCMSRVMKKAVQNTIKKGGLHYCELPIIDQVNKLI